VVGLYRIIINKYIINYANCHKLLSNDGITTQELVIDNVDGLFEGISLNARLGRDRLPRIGNAASAAKNLDEYQYIICSEIPSIADSNPYKKELQKYRIVIITSFAKLIPILTSRSDKELEKWNRFAQILLKQISEILLNARANKNTSQKEKYNNQMKAVFDFFDVPEEEVDNILKDIYSPSKKI
jgi:hypothetical protein